MTYDKSVKLECYIFIREIPNDITGKQIIDKIAEKLSMSLMLKELEINSITLDNEDYNIELLREIRERGRY